MKIKISRIISASLLAGLLTSGVMAQTAPIPGAGPIPPQNPPPPSPPEAALPSQVPPRPPDIVPLDVNWTVPDVKIDYLANGLPIGEVASQLRDAFKETFDILLPNLAQGNWGNTTIEMRMKQVNATEIFQAMNLIFANDQTPLQWELRMNGSRPVALLRVLHKEPSPSQAASEALEAFSPKLTKVYYVGDLLAGMNMRGDSNGQMRELVELVEQTYSGSFEGKPLKTTRHAGAQLFIVTGTSADIGFVESILSALRQKVERDALMTTAKEAQQSQKPAKPAPAPAPAKN